MLRSALQLTPIPTGQDAPWRGSRMTLTSKGRALEDGSEGDTIRIANTHSNTVIEGIVVGAHMVAVQAPSNALMN